jgi:hypothetical protein
VRGEVVGKGEENNPFSIFFAKKIVMLEWKNE